MGHQPRWWADVSSAQPNNEYWPTRCLGFASWRLMERRCTRCDASKRRVPAGYLREGESSGPGRDCEHGQQKQGPAVAARPNGASSKEKGGECRRRRIRSARRPPSARLFRPSWLRVRTPACYLSGPRSLSWLVAWSRNRLTGRLLEVTEHWRKAKSQETSATTHLASYPRILRSSKKFKIKRS